ncbi:YqaE/Pmp3 family membrane protein [Sediminibacillus massiliensis]|uniref:YqaE/Pmp3 family membrane protein n=1 Tax=Sediminibacillus massiliensis TaxID=1926277 RepID=UPI00098843FD|nr:YqaE/Pmp3 family membrane protein [Sediminibacillus massiliensis]
MRLLCIFLPPVPVFLYGKPIQGLINILLCLLLWIPAVIHSWGVVTDAKADKRMKKQVKLQAKYNNKTSS